MKDALTGDTLCDPDHPIILERPTFPEPVISMSIEPKTAADKQKLGEALTTLKREDPTFQANYDEETGQTIIAGMGELHLEILRNRLTRDHKVEVIVGRPKVAYKETITGKAVNVRGKHVKQSGGRGQFGDCIDQHRAVQRQRASMPELLKKWGWKDGVAFENKVFGGSIPKEYIPSVEYGVPHGRQDRRAGELSADQREGDAGGRQLSPGGQLADRVRVGRADRVQGSVPEGGADAAGADHEGRGDHAGGIGRATSPAT